MKTIKKQDSIGFTLIELSIVLVIIGLIVAAIVASQELVKQSRLNAIVTEANEFTAAFNAFNLQYNQWPGDMDNASSYWSGCTDAASNNCDGDDDRALDWTSGQTDKESTRFWQHLSLSGILPGDYDGAASESVPYEPAGSTTPVSSYPKGHWRTHDDWLLHNDTVYHKVFVLTQSSSSINWRAILTPTEAHAIDAKIDDGKGLSGIVRPTQGKNASNAWYAAANCVDLTNDYDLDQAAQTCVLAIRY